MNTLEQNVCKESPDGKHHYVYAAYSGKICKYCSKNGFEA